MSMIIAMHRLASVIAVKKWRDNHPDAYKAQYQKVNDKVKAYNAFAYQLRQIPKRLI